IDGVAAEEECSRGVGKHEAAEVRVGRKIVRVLQPGEAVKQKLIEIQGRDIATPVAGCGPVEINPTAAGPADRGADGKCHEPTGGAERVSPVERRVENREVI